MVLSRFLDYSAYLCIVLKTYTTLLYYITTETRLNLNGNQEQAG